MNKYTSNINLGIIGAGHIAQEHLNVIQALGGTMIKGITSRTIAKAEELAKMYSIDDVYENLDVFIKKCNVDGLLVLVSADQIFDVTQKIIPTQIPFFIEKPPGLIPKQTKILESSASQHNTKNMVGFNRRYYSIFHKGIDIINEHGQLFGVAIEGHERFWKIEGKDISDEICENWIFANSTHTIDLLRYFGGEINQINIIKNSFKEKNGDQFVASMEFDSGAIGTYTSHWYSPGGWSVTLYGDGVTVEFKPLEKGIWIDRNFEKHEIVSDDIDTKYKPGFYRQMIEFLNMLKCGKLDWPGQNLEQALKTMSLAEKFNYAK